MPDLSTRLASRWPPAAAGIAALSLLQAGAASAQPGWPTLQNKPVQLVANDWCPQHCESATLDKGYVVDIVTEALQAQGVPFSLQYVPWPRALRMVDRGEADGLLTPTVPGFSQYLFHEQAVGYQQYCFYTHRSSPWRYRKPADLEGRHVVMLADSGLGEVDAYIKAHPASVKLTYLKGERDFAKRLFVFLGLKRGDTVVLTTDVFEYAQQHGDVDRDFRAAGCLEREKMAVGLSRNDPQRSAQIGSALDQGIAQLRRSGRLAKILARYGLKDWAP